MESRYISNENETDLDDLESKSIFERWRKKERVQLIRKVFGFLNKKKTLEIINHNKVFIRRLNLNINDYKEYSEKFSSIEIELILDKERYGKFINMKEGEESYFHIYVNDDIDVCPLCHSVLDDDQTEEELSRGNELIHQGSEYPDVRKREKRMNIVMRAILFLFILAEIGLIIINRAVKPNFWWAGICGIAMVYIYSSMVYWIKHDSGFAAKIGLQLVLTMVLLVAIDYYFTGMNGWSLKFAIPGVLLFGDAIVFFLMMLNKQYWYSYSILLLFIGCHAPVVRRQGTAKDELR